MTDAKADYDVIIIGGGATGLAAALYSARAMQKTLILEKIACGGQILITDVIENYPGFPDGVTGPELAQLYEKQAVKAGAEVKYEMVESLRTDQTPKVVVTSDGQYTAKAVIIATGGEHNKLGVPGEETYAGKGVSYCATCDGNFFRNQPVAVVGGGDSAVQEALYLTQMTNKVTLIHRRDQLRASRILQERAFASPKLEFKWNTMVEEVRGNGLMESLLLKDVNTGDPSVFHVPGLFVFIGFHPNTQFLHNGSIRLDGGGHVITNIRMETNVPGIFAAGDVRAQSDRQLGSAVGDGITAALSAYHYITGE
ncbi:MAG: thioredoxin-disulfide reductase [Dehalococcoidia bacterium]|nr:thioredoxin-disulfide reductase [Dehalococcoidia bacterium]